jgi:ribonuclease Z
VTSRELVVLGCSSQVPTRHRNHNGYLLLWDGVGVLFDPGEGIQRQMTLAGVRSHQLHRICITHFHGDHCLGLPGVLQRISLDGVPHAVVVHHPASGGAFFERLRYASIYDERATVRPAPHSAEGALDRFSGLTLTTARLDHGVDTWGYRLQEDDGWTFSPPQLAAHGVAGPEVGRLLREGGLDRPGRPRIELADVATPRRGQSMAFLMDTRPCAGAAALARGVDLLVCESTYLDEDADLARQHVHMTAGEAGRLAAAAGARRLVLTHFSQRYGDTAPFVAQAARHHPDVIAAFDLLRVPVPPRAPA